ncbi:MAG: inositol monophosphatase family protein [Bacteroidia bacterium]|nr:inositol monophosphatase family protein [Bacteroidia bacterium]
MRNRLRGYLEFMQATARIAGAIMRNHWKKPVAIKRKADNTLVSEVDLRISNFLLQRVADAYPKHGLLTEESFQQYRPSGRGFIVDELDGTKAYLSGKPGFTFQMAYFEDYDKILIGLIYDPIKDLMIWSILGGEVYKSSNGFVEKVQVPVSRPFHQLRYGHHRHRYNPTLWNIYQQLSVQPNQIVPSGSIGSKAMNLVLGEFDVILGPHRHIPVWDWAAGKVFADNLGIAICHFDGSDLQMDELTTPHPFGYLICPAIHKSKFTSELSNLTAKKKKTKREINVMC